MMDNANAATPGQHDRGGLGLIIQEVGVVADKVLPGSSMGNCNLHDMPCAP